MEQHIKILLLEDFPEDAELIKRILIKDNVNHNILVVDNKTDFIENLSKFSPDIILSDHSLPTLNSIEALEIVKELGLKIPFILVTAALSEEVAVQMIKQGFDDYILKSNLTRLPSSVKNALQKYNLKKAEEEAKNELFSAHERLMFHLENSPLGYIEWDTEGLVQAMSKRAEDIFGYTEKEFKENKISGYSLVYKPDLEFTKDIGKKLNDGKIDPDFSQVRNVTKDGRIIWCEWFHSAIKDKDGEVTTLMSLVHDITERKKDEHEIIISEEKYRRIVETSQEGIWTIDENNKTNFVNKKICEILEYSQEEMMGKSVYDFMDEKGKKIADETLESQKKKPNESYEFTLITKSGKEVWIIASTNAIFDKNKEYLGALSMMTDITHRKKLELETIRLVENLQSKNKDLKQFAFMISHNLRSPIIKIQGIAQLLNSGSIDENTKFGLIESIRNEAANLDNIVKDINSIITYQDTGSVKSVYILFESKIEQVKQVLKSEIFDSSASIKTDFSEAEGVFTEPSFLYNIFYNLISNAIKYRRKEEFLQIDISSKLTENFTCIIISDNGSGIDLVKNRDKIFGLYKRFHDKEIQGRGIGLNLVKTQTESLGGKIEVESTVGKGTTFKIYIPNIKN